MTSLKSQRGVALVSVLLVVVIATVLTAAMVAEQKASIQQAHSFLERGQAMQYALGGEELARQILWEDSEERRGRDHLGETWASPDLHYEFEEGEINLVIRDLQGRLNINGLHGDNKNNLIVRQRLSNLVGALVSEASIVDKMADWIDADNNNSPLGAEDFSYMGLDTPYRSAGTKMGDISEVGLLFDVPVNLYSALAPMLTALPEVTLTLNINTASPEVLQSLAPGLTLQAAENIALRREEEEGFETVADFLQSPELAGLGVPETGLGVQSGFFEVQIIARYRDRFSYLTTVVQRDLNDGNMRVIRRSFAKNISPINNKEESGKNETDQLD